MAATQMFFYYRFEQPGNIHMFEGLEAIGKETVLVFDNPDAGLCEFRSFAKVHTFWVVMCWIACDRLVRIAVRHGLGARAEH